MSIPQINQDSGLAAIEQGFAFRCARDLKRDGVPVVLTGSTLQARILSEDGTVAHGDPVAVSSSEAGSNWAQGRVVVVLPSSLTAVLPEGTVRLQILVTDESSNVWPWTTNLAVMAGGPALG